jgi:dihydrofolate reductase
MKYNIIACINRSLALGDGVDLMYHIKSDLRNFRSITDGNIIVCGRKTYESLPKRPLKNRINIVLTRDKDYVAEGAIVLHSALEIIEYCEQYKDSGMDVYIIGGGEIYKMFLSDTNPIVDTIYLTVVNEEKEGKVKFPFNPSENDNWKLFYHSCPQIDDEIEYTFDIYNRRK